MGDIPTQPETQKEKTPQEKYQELVRQVAEQVWKLWKEELNRDRERQGNLRGS